MITKAELQYCIDLQKRKDREVEGKFLAEGTKIVQEALESHFFCELLLTTQDYFDSNKNFFNTYQQKLKNIAIVNDKDFEKVNTTVTPQGVVGVVRKKEKKLEISKIKNDVIIFIDSVSDPGNLGTIIRTADWFGFNEIILGNNTTDSYSPKCVRSSMGSIFHVNIYPNYPLKQIAAQLRGSNYQIYSCDLNGKPYYSANLKKKILMVLSNEANGPTEDVINLRDEVLTIPGNGKSESLNVAVAGSIILSKISEVQNS